jgi:AcrR family transcriptional regulator
MLIKQMLSEDHVDPRTKRTRQLLMQAIVELLNEKNFESITVQEIADRATVNRATFYAHFEDKYVLLDQTFSESFKQALHSQLPANAGLSLLNLQLLIQTVCEYLDQLYSHCAPSLRTQFDALVERQAKAQLYEFLLGWLRKTEPGRLSLQPTAELRATMMSWAIYAAALRWSKDEHRESVKEFARQVQSMVTAGLDGQSNFVSTKKNGDKALSRDKDYAIT